MHDKAYPASWTVRLAREVYLAENGFTVEAYEDAWTEASVLGLPLKVPNTPRHRWAIMRHDLHHVATGFGTDHAGEGELSAWELRRGLENLGLYVGAIVVAGALGGAALAPRRTLAAWRGSGKDRTSLFRKPPRSSGGADLDYEALLDMSVGDLREALGVPREGLAKNRALHARAPTPAHAL